MESTKSKINSLIAIAIIGFLLLLIINHTERILSSLIKLVAIILKTNHNIYAFIDIVPMLLVIIFWIFVVFVFLDKPRDTIDLKDILSRKFAVYLGLLILVLILISAGLSGLERLLWGRNYSNYIISDNYDTVMISKIIIVTTLRFLKVVIIFIGFIRIYKNVQPSIGRIIH